jgi:hypothetical protein
MIRKRGAFVAVIITALLAVDGLQASDEQIDRESLRALDGVRVAVEDLPAGAPKDLTKDSVRKFVEARLEAAHVPVQGPGEYPTGDPFLRVTIKTTAESAGVAGYHVALEFMQIVFVRRNPMLTFNRAQTWAANARMGLVRRGELTERVQKDLAEEVDQFIAAYKSVNSN